jgi:hypothetical protein
MFPVASATRSAVCRSPLGPVGLTLQALRFIALESFRSLSLALLSALLLGGRVKGRAGHEAAAEAERRAQTLVFLVLARTNLMCISTTSITSSIVAAATAPAGLVLLFDAKLGNLRFNLFLCQPTRLAKGVLKLKNGSF